jgi:hypothetical protein
MTKFDGFLEAAVLVGLQLFEHILFLDVQKS